MMPKLLLATNNQAKVREYLRLLHDVPFKLVTLAEEGIAFEISETGASLEENAILKATTYAAMSQTPALADDSGLEVDALGGEPGVRAARYAGENSSDKKRVDYLLAKLEDIPPEERSARFRCVIAIATPAGKVELCSGECLGLISLEPKGKMGFGYDPIFYLPELGKTMAELPMEVKNQLSHRGKAAREACQVLERLKEIYP